MIRLLHPDKYYFGKMCKRGHDHNGQGESARLISGGQCVECQRIAQQKYDRSDKGRRKKEAYIKSDDYRKKRMEYYLINKERLSKQMKEWRAKKALQKLSKISG